MTKRHALSRRRFLERLALTAVGSGALATQGKLGLMQSALAATGDYTNLDDYRSLVCVFLYGGNDTYNTIIPTDATNYNRYATVRGPLALANAGLHGLNGIDYGLHPSMGALASLYNTGKLAIVGNVGTLFEPTTRESYANGGLIPPNLFSHNDQQEIWQTARPPLAGITQPGWGGRMADLLAQANTNPYVPPTITLFGNNNFQAGVNALPFSMNAFNGVEEFMFLSGGAWPPWEVSRSQAWANILSTPYDHALERQAADGLTTARAQIAELQATLDESAPFTTEYPDGNFLAAQLRMVARVISIREQLGMRRQIFFVGLGGWDFHSVQLNEQAQRLGELSGALAAFQSHIDELSLGNSVTAFTATDFGRTLTVNGDGTDHAWGGAAFVMGGAVNGGAVYGAMPPLELGGPGDTDSAGRMIPEYSLDQYGATLARWMGMQDGDLGDIFPYLGNFPVGDIGFMT